MGIVQSRALSCKFGHKTTRLSAMTYHSQWEDCEEMNQNVVCKTFLAVRFMKIIFVLAFFPFKLHPLLQMGATSPYDKVNSI